MEFFLTYRIRGNKMHNKGDAVIRDISCHKHTLVPYSKAAYERLLIIVVQAISSECSDLIRVYSYTKMFLIKILLQYSQYTCFAKHFDYVFLLFCKIVNLYLTYRFFFTNLKKKNNFDKNNSHKILFFSCILTLLLSEKLLHINTSHSSSANGL